MKNAIILHGICGNPEQYWLPSIRRFLEAKGYEVWAPQLPDPDNPDLKKQVPFIMKGGDFNEETIMIGHSAACALILSVLENIDVQINKVLGQIGGSL